MTRKKIIVFQPVGGMLESRLLAGILDAANALRLEVSVVECVRNRGVSPVFIRSPGGETFAEVVRSVRPDGVIVVFNALPADALRGPGRRSLPAVFIDRQDASHVPADFSPVFVCGEADSCARLAARELFRSVFRDYAFLPFPGNPPWSRERGDCFERLVVESGKSFHPFPAWRQGGAMDFVAYLAPFLDSLPRPCGLFAVNDTLGEAALRICAVRGWDVPHDFAVVGMDNLEQICEATSPTLSSICRDLEGEGRAAAKLLAEWMASPRRRPASLAMPALHVVRRASTFLAADRRIARAMEFIRLHACEPGFAPPKVVREMGISRSQADLLFRRVVGRSILNVIHDTRIARAQDLLRAGKSASYAADTCGFGSHVDFSRAFKRHVGTTVRAWTLAPSGTTLSTSAKARH